jgi:hypothetical protein
MQQPASILKALSLQLLFLLNIFSFVPGKAQLSGTYTVGGGGNFPTIDSVFRRLSTDGIAGATIFTLTDTAYVASGKPLQNLRRLAMQ